MTGIEQRNRLAAAYKRMSPPGREALDRLLRHLAGLHKTVGQARPAGKEHSLPGKKTRRQRAEC